MVKRSKALGTIHATGCQLAISLKTQHENYPQLRTIALLPFNFRSPSFC